MQLKTFYLSSILDQFVNTGRPNELSAGCFVSPSSNIIITITIIIINKWKHFSVQSKGFRFYQQCLNKGKEYHFVCEDHMAYKRPVTK